PAGATLGFCVRSLLLIFSFVASGSLFPLPTSSKYATMILTMLYRNPEPIITTSKPFVVSIITSFYMCLSCFFIYVVLLDRLVKNSFCVRNSREVMCADKMPCRFTHFFDV